MALTSTQQATLKAAIIADATLNAFPNNGDGASSIKDLLNAPSSPAVIVWDTNTPVTRVFDSIDWSKYTPTEAADSTILQTNRSMIVQTKQMNLQNMLIGREVIDASKSNIRAGLRDAVIALPTGTLGANVTAGGASGVNVMNALTRTATRLEAILAVGTAQTGGVTAGLLTYVGDINYQEVLAARNS